MTALIRSKRASRGKIEVRLGSRIVGYGGWGGRAGQRDAQAQRARKHWQQVEEGPGKAKLHFRVRICESRRRSMLV